MKRTGLVLWALAVCFSASAQKYGNTPEDSVNCIQNLSIYQEFYKQKAYAEAYPAWKEVLSLCPATSLNTYIRGGVILKTLISKTTDAAKQKQYISELMSLWDLRKQYYGMPGYCSGMKARDMRTYQPEKIKEALTLFREALAYSTEKGFYPISFFAFECAIDAYKANLITKDELIDAYDRSMSILEGIAESNPDDSDITNTVGTLDIAFEPYAACADLIPIYEKKFQSHKTDVEFLKKATRMMNMRNCTESNLFFNLSAALYAIEPTPESAYLMARMCYSKKDYKKTVYYLADQAGKLSKKAEKVSAYLMLADSYSNLGRLSEGKTACLDALNVNPNEGKAYILLGNLYASGARQCGDEPQISQRAAYWAAVDKFIKAKSVDPSVADLADKLISSYRNHFPSGDDLFTFGYKEGQSYTIRCWFVETTTIRAR
ncbi:MAG: hypothetical protein RSA02_03235 [Bacteroidales bacterium]